MGVAPGHCLVVEDSPVNRIVVREMLELDGHSVMEANDGEEGVQFANARRWARHYVYLAQQLMD